jgi:hypothetical protein
VIEQLQALANECAHRSNLSVRVHAEIQAFGVAIVAVHRETGKQVAVLLAWRLIDQMGSFSAPVERAVGELGLAV